MKIKNIRKKATTSLLILFVLLVGFRIYLPVLVLNYSNKVLSDLPEYEGSIDDIELCLWKGQYTIKGLEIYKLGGNELPLIVAPKTNLSIQWSALKELEFVGEIDAYKPEVNFIIYDGKSKDQNSQTGTEVDWTKPIKDLMPLKINRFTVNEATLHYKDPAQKPAILIR